MKVTAEKRRLILEEVALSDSASPHERLRAVELLIEQDRLASPPTPERPPYQERDPAKLAKVAELLFKAGVFESEIERRTAQRLRERFNVVEDAEAEEAAEDSNDEEQDGGPGQRSEAVSEAESAADELPAWNPALAILRRSADDGDEAPTLLGRMRNRPRNH